MSSERLVAYVGDVDLHDAHISVVREQPGSVIVEVHGPAGNRIDIEFTGVMAVRSVRPVGMMLYALAELSSPGPGRRFAFVNWDESDDACLEVQGESVAISQMSG